MSSFFTPISSDHRLVLAVVLTVNFFCILSNEYVGSYERHRNVILPVSLTCNETRGQRLRADVSFGLVSFCGILFLCCSETSTLRRNWEDVAQIAAAGGGIEINAEDEHHADEHTFSQENYVGEDEKTNYTATNQVEIDEDHRPGELRARRALSATFFQRLARLRCKFCGIVFLCCSEASTLRRNWEDVAQIAAADGDPPGELRGAATSSATFFQRLARLRCKFFLFVRDYKILARFFLGSGIGLAGQGLVHLQQNFFFVTETIFETEIALATAARLIPSGKTVVPAAAPASTPPPEPLRAVHDGSSPDDGIELRSFVHLLFAAFFFTQSLAHCLLFTIVQAQAVLVAGGSGVNWKRNEDRPIRTSARSGMDNLERDQHRQPVDNLAQKLLELLSQRRKIRSTLYARLLIVFGMALAFVIRAGMLLEFVLGFGFDARNYYARTTSQMSTSTEQQATSSSDGAALSTERSAARFGADTIITYIGVGQLSQIFFIFLFLASYIFDEPGCYKCLSREVEGSGTKPDGTSGNSSASHHENPLATPLVVHE
ncbi:unnamed protein product [Amoebophrya sp. A120]|nr:unnamed protein product [Amoebophrya sp. A120]|eukprot:GSA120T00025074001.1